MPANPWELRADVGPLEVAAVRWIGIASLMTRHGDEIVDAARRATDGWDTAAAESYEEHRRQVLANLDRFTQLADRIAASLRAVGAIITSAQQELDRSWTGVALVPHEVVGGSRHLVFRPAQDDDRGKVARGQSEADEIRRRLALALDRESGRLRAARAELVTVRTDIAMLAGGTVVGGLAPGEEASGVGTVPPAPTAVLGAARSGQSGVSRPPPTASSSVPVPDLTGHFPEGLAPVVAAAAGGEVGRRRTGRTTDAAPPMGGTGAGAMGVRGGTMSRGMASGRSGPSRMAVAGKPAERRAERESRRRRQEAGALEPTGGDVDAETEHGAGLDPDVETGAEDESPRR